MDKPLKLEQLAQTYDVTARTLKRRFLTLFGVKLYNFVLDIRMKQASMLLLETDTAYRAYCHLNRLSEFCQLLHCF